MYWLPEQASQMQLQEVMCDYAEVADRKANGVKALLACLSHGGKVKYRLQQGRYGHTNRWVLLQWLDRLHTKSR